jgi:thiol-disulfide isomerase/thioredoxin
MRAVRALRLVDERDAPRAFGEAEDVALLYFTSKDCGACKRFAPTLMAFAKAHDVRVVAIACDASSTAYAGLDGSNFTRVRVREASDEDGTSVVALDEDGTSVVALNALLRALSIRFLPTVVVVNLKLDVVVTDWGRTVMSLNSNPLPAWRRGESGLIPNPMRAFMKGIEQCAYGGDSSAA